MKTRKEWYCPKITGKAKNAVQEQVNATFVSTVAEAVMKAGNALSMVNAGGQASVEGSLDSMQAQLQDYVVMLQSFQSIMTSAEMIMATSRNMLPDMDNMLENGRNTMIGMQTMINSSVDAVDVMGDMVSSSMDMVTEALRSICRSFLMELLEQMGSNNVGSTTGHRTGYGHRSGTGHAGQHGCAGKPGHRTGCADSVDQPVSENDRGGFKTAAGQQGVR